MICELVDPFVVFCVNSCACVVAIISLSSLSVSIVINSLLAVFLTLIRPPRLVAENRSPFFSQSKQIGIDVQNKAIAGRLHILLSSIVHREIIPQQKVIHGVVIRPLHVVYVRS